MQTRRGAIASMALVPRAAGMRRSIITQWPSRTFAHCPFASLRGGGARVRAIHVGNFPNHPGCTASHESVGLYIQNRCFRLGEKIQVRRKLLRDGGIYPRKRRGVLAWDNTGIQGERAGKKPFGASNNRVSGTSAQRKAGRSPPPHC